jgi:sugar lactone lactonase YvrE
MRRKVLPALAFLAALLCLPCAARANSIASVVADRAGHVYFSDYVRNRVWKVEPDGRLTEWVRRKHTHHLVADENGTLYGEDVPPRGGTPELWEMTPEGVLTDVFRARRMGHAASYRGTVFTIDKSGTLLYLRDCQIVRLTAAGELEPWAGRRCGGDVWASDTLRYGHLHGSLAWGPNGVLYFSDARTVRRVAPDGSVTTLSGRPVTLFADPQPDERRFDRAMGIAVDGSGNIYVADRRDRSIRRLTPNGKETTVARLPFFWSPTGLGRAGDDLYVVANLRFSTPGFLSGVIGSPAVFKITPDGRLTALATAKGKRQASEPETGH